MANFAPRLRPGVVKDNSELSSEGAYTDADKVRFRVVNGEGLPQIIGGQEKATLDTVAGKARATHAWEDNAGQKLVGIGTHKKIYVYHDARIWDVTPSRASGEFTSRMATVGGSTTVTVTHTAHGVTVGDAAYLQCAATVGGLSIGASGTLGSGLLETIQNSKFMIINHTAHGLTRGEYATLGSSAAVGGVGTGDIDKTHRVYVLNNDSYLIHVDTVATSSATGGGTPTYTYYHEHPVESVTDADTYAFTARSAADATASAAGGVSKYFYEENIGREFGVTQAGYGTGTYSSGYYSRSSTESDLRARVWHISNYGQNMVANYRESPLYRWANNLSQNAAALSATDAPAQSLSHFMTPERFLVALGTEDAATSTRDPMLAAWALQEGGFTNGDWTPAATNTAGDFKLAEGSRIVRGMAMPFVNAIWTDTAMYQMRYLQDTTFVFGFDLVGTGCGLIGSNAAVRVGDTGAVYWLSTSRKFFVWQGGAPQEIQCPVREWFFDRLANVQEELIFGGVNGRWNEIWWFYPGASNECDSYLIYNYKENHWSIGTYDISAWVDRGVLQYPIGIHTDGTVYLQERGDTDGGNAITWHVESGYIDLGDGDNLMMVRRVTPDFADLVGGATVTMTGKMWPQGTESEKSFGTLGSTTKYLAARIKARQVKVRYSGSSAPASGRLGRMTFDVQPSGEKR